MSPSAGLFMDLRKTYIIFSASIIQPPFLICNWSERKCDIFGTEILYPLFKSNGYTGYANLLELWRVRVVESRFYYSRNSSNRDSTYRESTVFKKNLNLQTIYLAIQNLNNMCWNNNSAVQRGNVQNVHFEKNAKKLKTGKSICEFWTYLA